MLESLNISRYNEVNSLCEGARNLHIVFKVIARQSD